MAGPGYAGPRCVRDSDDKTDVRSLNQSCRSLSHTHCFAAAGGRQVSAVFVSFVFFVVHALGTAPDVGHFRRDRSRRLTLRRMGVPSNPNSSRRRFTRNRSYEKCSSDATFVKSTNDGGAVPVCAPY